MLSIARELSIHDIGVDIGVDVDIGVNVVTYRLPKTVWFRECVLSHVAVCGYFG